jgi:hypothetical protein
LQNNKEEEFLITPVLFPGARQAIKRLAGFFLFPFLFSSLRSSIPIGFIANNKIQPFVPIRVSLPAAKRWFRKRKIRINRRRFY